MPAYTPPGRRRRRSRRARRSAASCRARRRASARPTCWRSSRSSGSRRSRRGTAPALGRARPPRPDRCSALAGGTDTRSTSRSSRAACCAGWARCRALLCAGAPASAVSSSWAGATLSVCSLRCSAGASLMACSRTLNSSSRIGRGVPGTGSPRAAETRDCRASHLRSASARRGQASPRRRSGAERLGQRPFAGLPWLDDVSTCDASVVEPGLSALPAYDMSSPAARSRRRESHSWRCLSPCLRGRRVAQSSSERNPVRARDAPSRATRAWSATSPCVVAIRSPGAHERANGRVAPAVSSSLVLLRAD
jgi:hypothetical protein